MIVETSHNVPYNMLSQALKQLPNINSKLALNEPTGDFFYDPWAIKNEFKNTVWEEILNTLPYDKGEARLIDLDIKTCYTMHSDIDDRWHLSFKDDPSYLVDLEKNHLFKVTPGKWHDMDAGILHSAVNFGEENRTQLVVRKLLERHTINNPINVTLGVENITNNYRFLIDTHLSPAFNKWAKGKVLSNFVYDDGKYINFTIDQKIQHQLETVCTNTGMDIKIKYETI